MGIFALHHLIELAYIILNQIENWYLILLLKKSNPC